MEHLSFWDCVVVLGDLQPTSYLVFLLSPLVHVTFLLLSSLPLGVCIIHQGPSEYTEEEERAARGAQLGKGEDLISFCGFCTAVGCGVLWSCFMMRLYVWASGSSGGPSLWNHRLQEGAAARFWTGQSSDAGSQSKKNPFPLCPTALIHNGPVNNFQLSYHLSISLLRRTTSTTSCFRRKLKTRSRRRWRRFSR